MEKSVLIIGSSRAEIQAAVDLADCGVQVHLVETKPFLGNQEEYLNPDILQNTRLLEMLKHPNITTWTNTVVEKLGQNNGSTQVILYQSPRYIDLSKCTACGECVEVCPITIPETGQKAIYLGGQPGCAVIDKVGISPCTNACPAGIHVQGYVALISEGRYNEAYQLIHDALPFPSVCGRVCNHLCETACNRSQLDQAVNLMGLKRYVADWAYENQEELSIEKITENKKPSSGKKVAVIGAGPAGLTAARDLVRAGHQVKVFDANPEPGGMMRVGIPPHRISYEQLGWEIDQILAEGIELQLDTWVDNIPELMNIGYDAVLIATGAHESVKVPIEGADHPDNWLSLNFLKKACLGDKIDLSDRQVIVLGGGDVAMDAARVAIRLGTSDVKVVCRGMRASFNEILDAEEEGVEILKGKVFQRILIENGNIIGMECLEAEVGDVVDGKRQFTELPGTEHLIAGDLVIWALGQKPDFSFLPEDDSIAEFSLQGIQADNRMMTTMDGVFTAGDVRRGTTFFVVDAVGEGHQSALAIHQYIMGEGEEDFGILRQEVILKGDEMLSRLDLKESARKERITIHHLSVKDRENNFTEVDLAISETEALQEAGRCLVCGPCSECMACLEVCEPNAIFYNQPGTKHNLDVDTVLVSEGEDLAQGLNNAFRIQSEDEYSGSAAAFQAMCALEVNGVYQTSHLLRSSGSSDSADERIGLVLCQCGGEISQYIDLGVISSNVVDWRGISFAGEIPLACSREGAETIQGLIKDQNLNKLILGACSCCSLDQICYSCTFQRLRCKENLGIFDILKDQIDLEFVNIREQCAWVHPDDMKIATSVAERLIKSTLSRLQIQRTDHSVPDQKSRKVLIIGKGTAAEICSDLLLQVGIPSERFQDIPKQMLRIGGHYLIKNTKTEVEADLVLLAPGDKRELNRLGKAHQMLNGRTIIGTISDQRDLIDFGVVFCPPDLDPMLAGEGAVAQIIAWLSRLNKVDVRTSAVVDPLRCRACCTCQEVCGFGIPDIVEDGFGRHAAIDPGLCLGCGICAAQCPSGAITPGTTSEHVLEEMFDAILG